MSSYSKPGNYPGSKFSVGTYGGRSGLAAIRDASALYRRGRGVRVNRQLFPRRGRGSIAPRMPFSMRGRYRRVSGNRRRVRQPRIKAELKNWDQAITIAASTTMIFPTGAGVTSGAVGAPLVGLAQGTSQNQRIGRKIVLKSIQVRALVQFAPAAGALGSDFADVYLIKDTAANKLLPVVADCWQSASPNSLLRNLDYGGRFQILKHERFQFDAGAGVSGAYDPAVRPLDWFVKVNDLVEINSTLGAFSEFNTCNYYIAMGSSSGFCSISAGNTRVRYTDM